MYAAGIVGLAMGLMALFAAVFMNNPQPAVLKQEHVAQNYAVAQRAVQEAVLVAMGQARHWAPDTPLVTGSACKTPISRATQCDILLDTGQSAEITAQLPPMWAVLTDATGNVPRWQGRIQDGMLYVYGAMSNEEMAALRAMQGTMPTMAFCKGGSDGAGCLPPLQEKLTDGSMQPLALPAAITGATNTTYFAVHATRIVQ